MTPQEQQLLQELFQRLGQTQGQAKDGQAEAVVRQGLAAVPDAAYWLAQRTLLLEQALQQAQQQIGQLQQQVQQGQGQAGAGSFLSGGLGTQFGRAPERPVDDGGYAPAAPQQAPNWRERWFGAGAAPRAAAPQAYAQPAAAGSSFLGNAAAAAAGVAGGMFLFNGLENLMGNHHGGGNSLFGGGGHQPEVQENITQNFYGDSGNTNQLARDAGVDHVLDAGSDGFDGGGDYFDDDSFA